MVENKFQKLNFILPIKIIKSQRKSLSVEIQRDKILIRAPKSMSEQRIQNFIYEKREWIEKHCNQMLERMEGLKNIEVFSEEELCQLTRKAYEVLPQKVEYYAKIIGVDYGRITIRRQRTRWGSCSSLGNLNFNCLLMCFPDEVIDSVVVHELCHRKEMNHSVQFYAEVEKAFPQYRECQKWLKENGVRYLAKLSS